METHHHRSERLAESLRIELDEILNYELSDPRITSISVTEVQLSPDHKKAHVRLAVAGTETEQAACLEAVEKAKSYIKQILIDRVDIFRLPDLFFDADIAPATRERALALLRRIKRGRARS